MIVCEFFFVLRYGEELSLLFPFFGFFAGVDSFFFVCLFVWTKNFFFREKGEEKDGVVVMCVLFFSSSDCV